MDSLETINKQEAIMKTLLKQTGKIALILGGAIIFNHSLAQNLELVNVEVTTNINANGDYSLKGSVKNTGTSDYDGLVFIEISSNRGANVSSQNVNDKVIKEHPLGIKKIIVNTNEPFEIISNPVNDSVDLRNIICVWPRADQIDQTSDKKQGRNIICVWPKKGNGKSSGKRNGRNNSDGDGIDQMITSISDLKYDVYPNPLVNITFLSITSPQEQSVRIQVMNNMGQVMKDMKTAVNEGQSFVEVDMNEMGPGIYFFKIISDHSSKQTIKAIKQ